MHRNEQRISINFDAIKISSLALSFKQLDPVHNVFDNSAGLSSELWGERVCAGETYFEIQLCYCQSKNLVTSTKTEKWGSKLGLVTCI